MRHGRAARSGGRWWSLFLVAGSVLSTGMRAPARPASASGASQGRAPNVQTALIRRVALLVPESSVTDRLQALLASVRSARARGRRSGLVPSPPSAPKPAKPPGPDRGRAAGRGPSADAGDRITPAQLRVLAQTLFGRALADRLHARLAMTIVPEADLREALAALRLSFAEAAEPEGARQLCARLDCDALFVPQVTAVAVHEGRARDLAVWGVVRIPGIRLPGGRIGLPARRRRASPPGHSTSPPPEEVMVAGAASGGPALFHSGYSRTKIELVDSAAAQAAALAVHTLWTGEAAPLLQPGERLAIAPVSAPVQADMLLFTAGGRQVRPGAVRNLPADVSPRFTPDLLPLFDVSIRSAQETRRVLWAQADSPASLWAFENAPNIVRVQALGRQLGVDYVLLARVTDIEVEDGPPERLALTRPAIVQDRRGAPTPAGREKAPEDIERAARAEAVGALVRVGDGALLWRDRAAATMTVRLSHGKTAVGTTGRQVAEDAVHFALLQLQRQFRSYRAGFER